MLVASSLTLISCSGADGVGGDEQERVVEQAPELASVTGQFQGDLPQLRPAPGGQQLAPLFPSAGFSPSARPQELFPGLNLYAVGSAGESVPAYRWLIEEDATYNVVPGVPDPQTLSVSFHKSYMPPVAHGDSTTPPAPFTLDPEKYYFISVLPDAGFAMGGTRFKGSDAIVTVRCPATPLPLAQISIFVFEDMFPVNGAPDLPEERGLAGFKVMLIEAGGRFGMAGGMVMTDINGNPIGTTYNPDGSVAMMGPGWVLTDSTGNAVIRNLSQGKFTTKIYPPRGQGWIQTSTIEGGLGNDAWIKPGEPAFFQEFGPPSWHTFFGFVRETNDTSVLKGGITISGQIVNLHQSRPPNYQFHAGIPFDHTMPYVGLSELAPTGAKTVFVGMAAEDGSFAIPNVPPGNYELEIWDSALDLIFAAHAITVRSRDGDLALGPVPVFQWFGQLHTFVFNDLDANGMWDDGEQGISDVPVNIRWRDGTMYQSSATDLDGFVPFQEVFPFFAWQVVEVDASRFKTTGLTAVVDDGGPIDPADPWSFGGILTPQPQPENGGLPYRVQTGPVTTQAFQSFIGTANVVQFGKQAFDRLAGENGGIRGMVYYDIMRGVNDPRYSGYEVYEPGIPRVQVALYRDGLADIKADVDNWPYGNFPGTEDVDWNSSGTFELGDAIAVTHTASWDDQLPAGCVGEPYLFRGQPTDCYDGLRVFNQLRPGVYDGTYAFTGIDPGVYIVEASLPRSALGDSAYQITKEEDRNFDYGDEYLPSTLRLPAECAGELHQVPALLTLFPDSGIAPPAAGQWTPLCDRRRVRLSSAETGQADFFMFTEVPIAGHIIGFILDDAANEFDPNAPTFGEKFAPPWLPVSIRDFDGTEIGRTYSDEYGVYNALVPSTYMTNNPIPSGMAPKMLTTCMNDPGPIPDPANPGNWITDPHYNAQYSQFCYTFQYMPGSTTYLDTPVIPVAAFAGPDPYPLDCENSDGTPAISSVSGPQGGPYVSATNQVLTITAMGPTEVPNPLYAGQEGATPKTISRDFGFGTVPGTVRINGTLAPVTAWSAGAVTVRVDTGTTTGDLVLTRGDNGKSTLSGVTVTVRSATDTYNVLRVPVGGKIQPAIDAALPGDLILVPPGSYYELLVMWKPVRLQGWGAGSTHIVAAKAPAEKIVDWRSKVMNLIASGAVSLIPNQQNGAPNPAEPLEPLTLFNEEGPGIIVLARNAGVAQGGFGNDGSGLPRARIDGLTISGGDNAGGVMVNGYAHRLVVSNNRIQGNAGTYGGGIRLGQPYLLNAAGTGYQSAFNDRVRISRNAITRNGGLEAVGGGIALYTGSDRYEISDNLICGNFSGGSGGGIGHLGLSDLGVIARNTIVFNETFFQQFSVHGGGIFIGGEAPVGGVGLTPGSGTVAIDRNLIQGNGATSGDGGGIRIENANGQDVAAARRAAGQWHRIDITNNVLANNVAAYAGGAISLQDAARVNIVHNTLFHNDSTGTAGAAFDLGNPNTSNPHPAGIVSYVHSSGLAGAFDLVNATAAYRVFSNPLLVNDVIWQNRAFHFEIVATPPPAFHLVPDIEAGQAPTFWDLGVLGGDSTLALNPRDSVLTSAAGYDASNIASDPALTALYWNGAINQIAMPELVTGIQAPPALDEGGNFIKVRFGPIALIDPATGLPFADGHLQAGSPAISRGLQLLLLPLSIPRLAFDLDGQARPVSLTVRPDVGADQR